MQEYIWINDTTPILKQLPSYFNSAAILLHPFVQMPVGWSQQKSQHPSEYVYPSDEEILQSGKPVSWKHVIAESSFHDAKELAIALKTSTGALNKKYGAPYLADKLNLGQDLFYPTDDYFSAFLVSGFISVLGSKGASSLYFSAPIFDKNGSLKLIDSTPLDICNLSYNEIILTDENMDFAFMSIYDSFITLFLAKNKDINKITETMKWEASICNSETYINWYL